VSWVADTSWLYALIDEADRHHLKARGQASKPEPVEVPEAILAETLDLIRYRHGKKLAEAALKGFERLPHFVLGEGAPCRETASVWRAHEGLSYADAAAVAAAQKRGFGLRSFDGRQLRALAATRPD
jgi:predicted nucleic acid-binding protein